MKIRKIGFWLLWMGAIAYAFLLAPPDRPDTLTLIKNMSIGQLEGINPLIVALFYIMGVWPMIYSCVLFIDGQKQKIPAWPFATASFAVGAFAILPYLASRQTNPEFTEKNAFLKLLDSRWTGVVLTIITLALVTYGLLTGDWGDYIQQFLTSRFIHVMSLDFCLLCLVFPALLGDDMARRGMKNPRLFQTLSLIPLFGPLIYLCLRSSLPDSSQQLPGD